ncbi:restriction endonuclease subunit S [Akkermansia muciniphila]|uniref:restriction endonuclease subunit S n=1 Tax=Akkermansia muciniphila TaxID=239935 RepID=UPI0020A42FC8|nr:restriction endonuclease subunit S [Akkermansia muciniphila]MCP2382999.1 restriction endonuclease subunit S [Akkermansia muciniphila]
MADTENNKNSNSPASTSAPALRFPGFTEPWQKCRLGDYIRIFSGESPNRINSEYDKIPYYKVEQLNWCEKYLGETPYLSQRGKNILPEGCVVFSKRGAAILTNKVRMNLFPINIDTNLMGIKADNSFILDQYLFYFILRARLNRIADTSTIPQINNIHINPITIYVPSLAEQEIITKFLALLDERIATQRRLIEDLEKLMSSINETLYATLTINYKTSFNEIGCDYGGLTGKSAEDFGKGKPFITYLNVYQNQIITGYNFDYVEIRDRENQNKVRKGDLLFTLSSETPEEAGYSAVYMGDAKELYLNSFCFGIHIPESEMVYPPYMGYLTSTSYFRRKIIPYAQGSTRFNLHKPSLMSMKFSLPAKENQIKIFNTLQLIAKKISTEQEILSNFTQQRNYLLTKLFI